ncbi:nicotinamide-nucleotide amidohydrolase family protein [Aestuariibacter sp. AA17]|uniref:Nicotinamide-nucleotide amidohydrolase family protein n=1 Tax=Fluctibacter corallii TaxID=2984329 RepID=A0ABT3A472_9ALTE|nr:nicotinamide-nucleotide amidohydrolase family protein [Aestuariibacter sp. AA17]MCV2883329.1 nicotinamide-nucleotide amidohydrolase family protein [Aestuariibacter sp. AA17]
MTQLEMLSERLGQVLLTREWTVTTAESCTGGGIGAAITDTAGSSAWFEQGFITYSNEAKIQALGVSDNTLSEHGAVSEQTVLEMAKGAACSAKAKCAVSVSGIAGPGGATSGKPVGTVWFGFYVNGQLSASHRVFSGNRQAVRNQAVEFALTSLIEILDNMPD